MITPSFGLTATERVLPNLALDFTTAILDPRITFTRSGNTATYTDSSGVITAINANLPRFDYNPTTLICQGLLIEEARTNVLVNSLINGTNLSTQSVTTTAVAYTLSFYGTGNIVLSGTSTGTVTGTGAYPSRKTFTFTPTAGTLTLTVSGTVQYAQLEVGAFATSFIPTTTAQTRNADVATMTGTNFSSWYNASEGTFQAQGSAPQYAPTATFPVLCIAAKTGGADRIWFSTDSIADGNDLYFAVRSGGSNVAAVDAGKFAPNTVFKIAGSYKVDNFQTCKDGGTVYTDSAGAVPTGIPQFNIGVSYNTTSGWWNGHVQKINYWPQQLTAAELQAFTK